MKPRSQILPLVAASALFSERAATKESIEFVAEHLPEIAMDDRYASLPSGSSCRDARFADDTFCTDVDAGYAEIHSGTLSFDGLLLSLSASRPLGDRHRLTGFAFYDTFSLESGLERRPLDTRFVNVPLTQPAEARFTALDGKAYDFGLGLALGGSADWNRLPSFEWSAGLLWQRLSLNDYRFDYRIVGGPDTGAVGSVDFSAAYMHVVPFVTLAWPRAHGAWSLTPHVQMAMPLPRRGVQGHIVGAGFDLRGNSRDNDTGTPFGDPSVTIGFDLTYRPWGFTVDVGSAVTQALIEPKIHEGVQHNLLLNVRWALE